MLPRLRFIVAAIAIAVLPIVALGSGFITAARDNFVPEHSRPSASNTLRSADNRDPQQPVFAFARRSSELSRLRDLAGAPVEAWISKPAGGEAAAPIEVVVLQDTAAVSDMPSSRMPSIVPFPKASPRLRQTVRLTSIMPDRVPLPKSRPTLAMAATQTSTTDVPPNAAIPKSRLRIAAVRAAPDPAATASVATSEPEAEPSAPPPKAEGSATRARHGHTAIRKHRGHRVARTSGDADPRSLDTLFRGLGGGR